jgi:hypothetical protein
MLVSDPSFIQLLREAEIVGCAYNYAESSPLGVPMREIAVVGRNKEPLAKAFEVFKRWANTTDGDAVELTFIFLADGGYLLCIQREYTRAIRDLGGGDSFGSPMMMGGIYTKKFDTRHAALEELRKFKRKLISPFLFGAAAVTPSSGGVPNLGDVQPIQDLEPLLKFEAEFHDEKEIRPGTSEYLLLRMSQRSGKKSRMPASPSLPRPKRQDPEDYFRQRRRRLERNFPVTIERIRSERYSEMVKAIKMQGAKGWQFEQAICNLLLSTSLFSGQLFYRGLGSDDTLTTEIIRALRTREEKSETPEATQFSIQDIVTQVRLDAIELLRAAGRTPPQSCSLDTVQRQLAYLKLLEPQDA